MIINKTTLAYLSNFAYNLLFPNTRLYAAWVDIILSESIQNFNDITEKGHTHNIPYNYDAKLKIIELLMNKSEFDILFALYVTFSFGPTYFKTSFTM